MTERIDIMSLPEPSAWSKGPGTPITAPNYAFMRGGLTLAVGFGRFFWPVFVEVQDCIVNADRYNEPYFEECRRKFGDDNAAIERVVNQTDMESIYTIAGDNLPDQIVDSVLSELAFIVAQSWKYAAKTQWPDREFATGIEEHNAPPSVWISTSQ